MSTLEEEAAILMSADKHGAAKEEFLASKIKRRDRGGHVH